jgi:hypothetical protein
MLKCILFLYEMEISDVDVDWLRSINFYYDLLVSDKLMEGKQI